MKESTKCLLSLIGLYIFVKLYEDVSCYYIPLIKRLICKHEWKYWKMHLHCDDHRGIDNSILIRWRRCDCCGKKQEMNMLPGNWHWVKSYEYLPEDDDTIHIDVLDNISKRRESLSDKRDMKLNELLK